MKLTLAAIIIAASTQIVMAHSHSGYYIDDYSYEREAAEQERIQQKLDRDFRLQRHETDQEMDRLRSEMQHHR